MNFDASLPFLRNAGVGVRSLLLAAAKPRGSLPCGSPSAVARKLKGFCDAGMRVFKVLEYGARAGLKFGVKSAKKVRETEGELLRLVGEAA
jgi:hypothetical protein